MNPKVDIYFQVSSSSYKSAEDPDVIFSPTASMLQSISQSTSCCCSSSIFSEDEAFAKLGGAPYIFTWGQFNSIWKEMLEMAS